MKRFIRAIARTGRDSDVWPVALLLFAVLVPAICLLWFMSAAMRNERLAARQKSVDLYRAHLSSVQKALEDYWRRDVDSELIGLVLMNSPQVAFAKAIKTGLADSMVFFDAEGQVAYPNKPAAGPTEDLDRRWAEAGRLEYREKDFAKAANLNQTLAQQSTNVNTVARALQAQARCLLSRAQTNAAVRLVAEHFGHARFQHAADAQGRLIAANVELMAFELAQDPAISLRLQQRLMDYENPMLASAQRRFLMKELRTLAPGIDFPTLAAEELAAQVPPSVRNADVGRIPGTDLWQRATPNARAVALFYGASLARRLQPILGDQVKLLPPGVDHPEVLIAAPASGLPGWQIAVMLDRAPKPPVHVYLWTALLVLSAVTVLGLLAGRVVHRRVALARLKNDLTATVSHELKTPLSSMRVLVDTLLDSEKLNEQTTREYLELIACENDRLSRLIHNFLTFSRIERKQEMFEMRPVPVQPIINRAVKVVPDCKVELDIQSNLPEIKADPDAIGTALINLLENACKYSKSREHITLRAHANNGSVVVSVQDKGVGIPPRELKKIFKPFYQVDQSLSRKAGGCGLGLSIVHSIVSAHHGKVAVESEPGQGSTFTISIPAAKHT